MKEEIGLESKVEKWFTNDSYNSACLNNNKQITTATEKEIWLKYVGF